MFGEDTIERHPTFYSDATLAKERASRAVENPCAPTPVLHIISAAAGEINARLSHQIERFELALERAFGSVPTEGCGTVGPPPANGVFEAINGAQQHTNLLLDRLTEAASRLERAV